MRTLGGTVGHFHSRVEDAPVFHPGEEVYLFLWGREGQPLRVLGWSLGTFRIARDAKTGAETVTQDSATASVFDPQSRRFVHEGIRNLPISLFQMKLKRALQGDPPR